MKVYIAILLVIISGIAYGQENLSNETDPLASDPEINVVEENATDESGVDTVFPGSRDPPSESVENSRISALVAATKTGLLSALGGENALLLLSGGLFLMIFLIPLAIVSSIFFKNVPELNEKNTGGTMLQHKYELGYNTGGALTPRHEDDILETLTYLENVDIKIVSSSAVRKLIRVKNCRSCKDVDSKKPVCDFERGFLQGSFEHVFRTVEVVENSCIAMGAASCEFEIKLKK